MVDNGVQVMIFLRCMRYERVTAQQLRMRSKTTLNLKVSASLQMIIGHCHVKILSLVVLSLARVY